MRKAEMAAQGRGVISMTEHTALPKFRNNLINEAGNTFGRNCRQGDKSVETGHSCLLLHLVGNVRSGADGGNDVREQPDILTLAS
ncbi:hypothetical protein JYG55_22965, partial [Escherichia fergusonii]|nr:hypothetical protein [Escherichia fergusonii]MBZ4175413.1 hypothetical protein [Escherichia fergusonii]